jgi:hypothetical protein
LELSLKLLKNTLNEGFFGVELSGEGEALRFSLVPESKEALITSRRKNFIEQRFKLPDAFDMNSFHLLRIQVNGKLVSVALDNQQRWQSRIATPPARIRLLTHKVSATFAGLALTYGWEDLFTEQTIHPSEWQVGESSGDWRIRDQELWNWNREDQHSVITKGPLFESYELVVNARLDKAWGADGCYGFYPMVDEAEGWPLFTVESDGEGWSLFAHLPSGRQAFRLPADFDPHTYQQFRFRKLNGRLTFRFEAEVLGEMEAPDLPTRVGLFARGVTAAFDMVRVTRIIDNMNQDVFAN